ncbi:type II toxin-antitoxin system HipA family toxin [Rhodococcus sp. IEGM 1379]|uniref:type II toxin-antitoxin system HipA family toxin n=1 Tax=Rhodococcus sp. IEGM 1379 TaxID=3047086 RepID=UPI0024B64CA4|nr:type II toxin-antitoxin system HipA family toxin [Rhodococcus sp. IEGM 1379]MDI9916320.1 type II toxin-antitoxin system HipA family toxin [Rhodococcus sp. IEGM 1379]
MKRPPADSLREVENADVYINDTPVATLTRNTDDSIQFDYNAATPTNSSIRSHSVSWSLLIDGHYPVVTTAGAVPPFFAGLLPEGVRLGAVVSSTKTSVDDHLTLLLAVGADMIGNVRVVPTGTTPPERLPMFSPERDTDFRNIFGRLAGSVDEDPVALAGVQPKVSANMWSVPTSTASGPAILKLTPPTGFPSLSENEHFFMEMAAACGLRVPRTRLLHDAVGRSALLVERFDRVNGRRIAQEDACQVSGLYPASKYRLKTETAITTLTDACTDGGGSKAAATLELLRTVAFSWLIGNGDLHGKNLSIYAPDEIWQPSPAYDLLSTQPYTGWNDPMAMNLYGRANRLTRSNFIDAGHKLGLRERAVTRMLDALVNAAQGWPERCTEIGFDRRTTELLTDLLRHRMTTLT